MVKGGEAAVKTERDHLKTMEVYLEVLKRLNESVLGKPSAMEKQLDQEIKGSSDLNAQLEKDKQRVDAALRHARALEEEVKRPYDIPNLEERVAELREECKLKEGERAIDEKLQKARLKKHRAAQDELNAFIVQLAKLKVEGATIKTQIQELQDESRHARASATTETSQPVVKTPQSKPCSASLDASNSFHFETLATPSTSKTSISMGAPARLEEEPSAAPSMSPLLMPPPIGARPRPAAGGPKPEYLTLLSELLLQVESATAPKPAARKRPVSSTCVDLSIITPPCKRPQIDDGGALSSTPALKPPHQQLHVPPNERASLPARATPAPPGTQHEVASAPARATSSQPAAANAVLPFGKQTSPGTPQDKRSIPAPPMNRCAPAPNDQGPPGHGRQLEEQTSDFSASSSSAFAGTVVHS
ncbi:translation initiation factor IF-2 [Dermacentor silvarum]|uniref:translation initiation factor IF-2 n=1 Tax=Dermacentor silvarum TaxID=543639 RepID=UPI001898D303|nr:translation initiation factor IF-2 [Dermacentor silvarum]